MSFNIVVCGPKSVGKTTWIRRLVSGEYSRHYVPSVGYSITTLPLHTTVGSYSINIYDVSTETFFNTVTIKADEAIKIDAVVVMLDYSTRLSLRNWVKRIKNVPLLVVFSKYDTLTPLQKQELSSHTCISARTHHQIITPLLTLIQKINTKVTEQSEVKLVEGLVIVPEVVFLSQTYTE